LIGDSDGAITTPDDYAAGIASYAHLYPDGIVRRFGEEIGRIEDIEFGEPCDVPVGDVRAALANICCHPSWETES
jgi:hypothetical protein